MNQAKRRFLLLLALLPIVVLVSAFLYQLGMAFFEGEKRDFWAALEFAAETITTTGYGGDASWDHPMMVVFVVLLQFSGVILIYMIVPIYLVPYFVERFESRLPRQIDKVEDHVVIYRYGPAVETVTRELLQTGKPLIIVEHDEAIARRLLERKKPVIYTDSIDEGLTHAHLEEARALIANGSDEENAALLLATQQRDFGGEVLALVEEPYHRKPIQLAGATGVYTPRHVLGAALAARASHRISPRVSGIQQLGRKLQVSEIPIAIACEIADRTLAEAEIGHNTGATIIGLWRHGRLDALPAAETRLRARDILVAVGNAESLDRLTELATGGKGHREGPFIVAGFGEVGQKVTQLLHDAGEAVKVIDLKGGPGVDIEGDVLEPGVLDGIGIDDAQALILALDNDSSTLFAAVIAKNEAPDVPIIARVNEAENVERIHHAGADFALSISQVAGQILAHRLFHQEAIAIDPQLRVLKAHATKLEGGHPQSLDVRRKTGCSIVAVERDDELIVDFEPDFRFRSDDVVYVCGTNASTLRFKKEYG